VAASSLTSSADDVTIDGVHHPQRGPVGARAFEAFNGRHRADHSSTDVLGKQQRRASRSATRRAPPTTRPIFRHKPLRQQRHEPRRKKRDGDLRLLQRRPTTVLHRGEPLREPQRQRRARRSTNTDPVDAFWLITQERLRRRRLRSFRRQEAPSKHGGRRQQHQPRKNNKGPGPKAASGILIGGDNDSDPRWQDNKIKDGDATGIRVQNIFGTPGHQPSSSATTTFDKRPQRHPRRAGGEERGRQP